MAGVDDELMTPPGEAVEKAVRASGGTEMGRVSKVLFLDDSGESVGEYKPTQIPEDPFTGYKDGIQEPPFHLEQLVFLAESHPVHSAAIEQKVADIVGRGWDWKLREDEGDAQPDQEGANAREEQRKDLQTWFNGLAPDDESMKEILDGIWDDVETVGWGMWECARDPQGIVRKVYHVPAHTVRAHRNGFKLVQIRDSRRVWFRRWGSTTMDNKPVEVDARTGSMKSIRDPANDMFVVKKRSRRSTWYGIPGYVSAIGWITLALAARDDNLFFFQNRREPRWAIVLSNLADDPDIEEDLRRAFTVDLRQPHRNVIIPISGPGKIEFNKMSADTKAEGTFDLLDQRASKAIMISHRVPGSRVANTEVGQLGGNTADVENKVYKEGVVTPGQEVLQARINNFIRVEYAKSRDIDLQADPEWQPDWEFVLDDLDLDSDREDTDLAVIKFHGDLILLREARAALGLGPLMVPCVPIQDPNAEVPMVDNPAYDEADPTSGLPKIPDPNFVHPMVNPTDPTTGLPYPEGTTEIESPFNDKIFSELPGNGPAAPGNPSAQAPGTGGLAKSLIAARTREADPMMGIVAADVRESLRAIRATHADILAAAAQPAKG